MYQLYQSALAWTELKHDEFLYLEVAEDYAIVAKNALKAVQVKKTTGRVTINSDGIIATIDSFVELQEKNPGIKVTLRHLTTSQLGKEKKLEHRVGKAATLVAWRNLAKAGDLSSFRRVLGKSKLSQKSKDFIESFDDEDLRERLLKRIHFDCGAPESSFLERQFNSRISSLLLDRGGVHSQARQCAATILLALLRLSTNPNGDQRCVDRSGLEEHLEEASQIVLNRAAYENQSRLVNKALSASVSSIADLSNERLMRLSSVSETPLPKTLASREGYISNFRQTLESTGICWIAGAAGIGKTVSARVLAHMIGGDWAGTNLRGLVSDQIARVLFEAADSIKGLGVKGLIIDDLDCAEEPFVFDSLCCLVHSANRSDTLLILNSSVLPTSDLLFACSLPESIAGTLTDFTEEDVREILQQCGVANQNWTKYIHLVSGGGHPQLAMAFIQSMASSGWNPKELQTLDALLGSSPAIDEVRRRTRERLLNDMLPTSRRLIERLSLKSVGFSRELAIDLGELEPKIPDAAIVLETLIGSWVDQMAGDRFNLSPLLSGFAEKTLGAEEKEKIQSAIADSLTKKSSFDVIDMNSALLAAWSSNNEAAMLKLCIAILSSDFSELDKIAPHLFLFAGFKTDTIAFPANHRVSHLFRGAQVLLLNQESESPEKIQDALRCFSEEAANVEDDQARVLTDVLVYSKLMLQTSKGGMGTSFTGVICKLHQLLKNEKQVLPSEALEGMNTLENEGITTLGFMFVNQARQLSKIEEISCVFDFLDKLSPELRSRLLAPFDREDFAVDMLLAGAWLSEHKQNTIDPIAHSTVFARLEEQAVRWNRVDLAVCCRKYLAIILDEYGNDKDGALAFLEDGLSKFGQTNSELVRAKAKVLYRSDDHEGSLALSRSLIDSDAPLDEIEKAFLGREAAISAEKQKDFETARRYYFFGRDAARKSEVADMMAMSVGLLADAALASWHDGDRQLCLQEFVQVLEELNDVDPAESVRTAHCHAVSRHVLLWLHQEATGEKVLLEDGEETVIYPGCVSNPEPHPMIGDRYVTPIEMAWYMLARVENSALLNAGITDKLDQFLPRGPVLEGQMLLSSAKMHKALSWLDEKLFVEALEDTISLFAFVKAKGGRSGGLDVKKVTYGTFPIATEGQQEDLRELTERFVLLYCATCVLKESLSAISAVVSELSDARGFLVRQVVIDILQKDGPEEDFFTGFACLVFSFTKNTHEGAYGSPREVFELAFKVLLMGQQTGHYRMVAENVLPWLLKKWSFVWERQRFQLKQPLLHEPGIRAALERNDVSAETKVAEILTAVLPTLGIGNQHELSETLLKLPR